MRILDLVYHGHGSTGCHADPLARPNAGNPYKVLSVVSISCHFRHVRDINVVVNSVCPLES
jgi:hypothetical protein